MVVLVRICTVMSRASQSLGSPVVEVIREPSSRIRMSSRLSLTVGAPSRISSVASIQAMSAIRATCVFSVCAEVIGRQSPTLTLLVRTILARPSSDPPGTVRTIAIRAPSGEMLKAVILPSSSTGASTSTSLSRREQPHLLLVPHFADRPDLAESGELGR